MKLITLTILLFASMSTPLKSGYLNKEEISLHYIFREPKLKQKNPPLIILLHGIGSNEKDLFSFANQLPDKYLVVSARAPYEIGQDKYAWYNIDFSTGKPVYNKEKAEKSRTVILKFIQQLKEKHSFDDKQVYLCGFSQGAIMAYSVGLTRPDKIKGIAVMSGRMLEDIKPLIKPGEQLKQLSVFISHGTRDDVFKVQLARECAAYVKGLGITPTYKEYPEAHTISNAMIADLIIWLNKK